MAQTAQLKRQSSRALRPGTWRKYLPGCVFLLPALLMYAVFLVYPFFQSIYLSLTNWDGAQPTKTFIGLANYGEALHDPLVWSSLWHNLIWVVIGTVSPIVIALFLAVLVQRTPFGRLLFRTVYFMPQLLPAVIVGMIWGWIYNPLFGMLNNALTYVGLGRFASGWLGDPGLALYAVLAAAIWAEIGFVFVIFVAGLQNISAELLEAAVIDGANAWWQFWSVTLPGLRNVLTMVTVLLLIGGFNVFDIIFIMTGGGPMNSTDVIATYTYEEAFTQNRVGYGATLSLVMTAISLIASIIFIRLREREEA